MPRLTPDDDVEVQDLNALNPYKAASDTEAEMAMPGSDPPDRSFSAFWRYAKSTTPRISLPLMTAQLAVVSLGAWFRGEDEVALGCPLVCAGAFALRYLRWRRDPLPIGAPKAQVSTADRADYVVASLWVAAVVLVAAGAFYTWSANQPPSVYRGLKSDGLRRDAQLVSCSQGVQNGIAHRGECRISLRFAGKRTTWRYSLDMKQFEGVEVNGRIPVFVDGEDGMLFRVYTVHDVDTSYRAKATTGRLTLGVGLVLASVLLGGFARFFDRRRYRDAR